MISQDYSTPDGVHVVSFPWPVGRIAELSSTRPGAIYHRSLRANGPDVIVLKALRGLFTTGHSCGGYEAGSLRPLSIKCAQCEYVLRKQKHGGCVCVAVTRWREE